ncbi:MAG TPA: aldehyde dehydrogenase family protein, partial [Acidimicrobiales bacterium]|nr:aldehyde dehydrogenase family protein [Acidimicrobiales bacterium]
MVIERDSFFINGQWVKAASDERLEVTSSGTGEVYATVPAGTVAEAERAVEAAAAAFPSWANTSPKERSEFLSRIAERLGERADEIALTIAHEVGMPLMLSKGIQVGLPTMTFAHCAQRAAEFTWEEQVGNSTVVREPVGVVVAITPWNYPLHQIANKVAPALAAGCTVVLKPSEVAPINAYHFGEIVDEVGLPAGVFNMVTGLGPVVGEAMAAHPKVDMISFTGSTRAGKRVMGIAAERVKRVALELGGKSANVILEGADLTRAVGDGVFKCYLNSGQTCSALTRMLVPRAHLAEVEELAVAAAAGLHPADPITGQSLLGPLVSTAQVERVRGYIRKGIDEGARLVYGGAEPPEGLDRGHYVRPTIFSDVRGDMTIAQEEIF